MKSVPVDNIVQFCGRTEDGPRLPEHLCSRLRQFMVDKHSGNMVIHIKSGAVLSYRIEETYRVTGTPD